MSTIRRRLLVRLIQLTFIVGVGAVWHLATRGEGSQRLVLPKPAHVLDELWVLLGEGDTYSVIWQTVREVATAYAIAAALGLSIGAAAGASKFWRGLVEPVLSGLYAVPVVLAYPICVLVFGIGSGSKIAFGTLFAFFPIALHALRGVAAVDPGLLTVGRSLGAGGRQQLLHIRMRSALPMLAVGLQQAAVLAYLSVVSAQLLVGTGGLGRRIGDSMESFQTPVAFAWIAIAIAIAFAISTITQLAVDPGRVTSRRTPARPSPLAT